MAITSKSKLRDVLADPRAVAIIEEYKPGFVENFADMMTPCLGMRMSTLLKFPQVGISEDAVKDIITRLDALDA